MDEVADTLNRIECKFQNANSRQKFFMESKKIFPQSMKERASTQYLRLRALKEEEKEKTLRSYLCKTNDIEKSKGRREKNYQSQTTKLKAKNEERFLSF